MGDCYLRISRPQRETTSEPFRIYPYAKICYCAQILREAGLTSLSVDVGLLAGFAVVMSVIVILNKAGDVLYRKGIAKPFYVLGHRLHHKRILTSIVPASYGAVALLVYLHYMRILWYSFWTGTEVAVLLSGVCLTIDMAFDALSSREKRMALLHHEWIYLLVPAYVFTHLVAIV